MEITNRQRLAQEKKIKNAIDLLEVAKKETKTATPGEISETLKVALEIINSVNGFLISRQPLIDPDPDPDNMSWVFDG